MVAINVGIGIFITLLGVIGLLSLIKFIIEGLIDNKCTDITIASLLGIVSLAAVIFAPYNIRYGLTTDVNFVLKNTEGKTIEKTVKLFEFEQNGNCITFADYTTYCGWEVTYTKND